MFAAVVDKAGEGRERGVVCGDAVGGVTEHMRTRDSPDMVSRAWSRAGWAALGVRYTSESWGVMVNDIGRGTA